jgi:chitin disaccharide deacetylase
LKRLIINADDFGFTREVNAGIVHAHRHGILTSTTLMANGDAFEDAVRLARETPTLDIGGHMVLIQGRSLVTRNPFPEKLRDTVLAIARGDLDPYHELRAQIEKIQDTGIELTHLDSHKHTHIVPKVFRAMVRLAHEFRVPYVRLPLDTTIPLPGRCFQLLRRYYTRLARDYDVRMTDHFIGFRLTGSLNEKRFAAALESVGEGTTEFMCHPGFLGPELQAAATRLKQSRVEELQALISPRIRALMDAKAIRLEAFRRDLDQDQ